MATKSKKRSVAANEKSGVSRFAILEQGLRIAHVLIKIAITVFVPKGKHIYELELPF